MATEQFWRYGNTESSVAVSVSFSSFRRYRNGNRKILNAAIPTELLRSTEFCSQVHNSVPTHRYEMSWPMCSECCELAGRLRGGKILGKDPLSPRIYPNFLGIKQNNTWDQFPEIIKAYKYFSNKWSGYEITKQTIVPYLYIQIQQSEILLGFQSI